MAGLAAVGALAFAAPAAAAPFPTACTNTVTNNNTQVEVTEMSATVPASVKPSTDFGVTDIKGVVVIPGSVFLAGYQLELVNDGDEVPGTLQMIMGGTNTTQLSQPSQVFNFLAKVKINDPDGVPRSGDETADDVPVPFVFPDMSWTSGPDANKAMAFSVIPVAKTSAQKDKGGMMFTASIPTGGAPLLVKFGCNPGTVTGDAPGVPNYTDSAAPYAGSEIKVDAPVVTPPATTPPPPPVAGAPSVYTIPNAFTFGKVKLNRKKGTARLRVRVPGAGVLTLRRGKTVGRTVRPSQEGRVNLVIKARGKAKRRLKRKGRLKTRLVVSYTPAGGSTLTKSKKVTLKQKKKSKKGKRKKK